MRLRMRPQIEAAIADGSEKVDGVADALIDTFDHFWMIRLNDKDYPRLLKQVENRRDFTVMSAIGDSAHFERTIRACYLAYVNHERGLAKYRLLYHRFVHAVAGG